MHGQTMSRKRCLGNERGFALILVLVMLTILSILGSMVLSTSSTEMNISGNYRNSREAFFAADRAIEYAMANPSIVRNIGVTDLNATDADPERNHRGNLTLGSTGLDPDAQNQVVNFGAGQLPAKLKATYGDKFGANYYLITVTGARFSGTEVRSSARVEAQRIRLFPVSSEGLTTTEGG